MGLSSLDAALSGLRIANQQISVISNNVANVGTPGFTRKILPQSSQAVNGVTVGVLSSTVIRNVNLNLERDLWTQISSVGSLNVQSTYLQRIQDFHGAPDKEISIAADIGKLSDSFSALADSPSDSFLQSNTINQAIDTAQKINNLSNLITTQRNDAQGEMKSSVDRINDLLGQIATINSEIEGAQNVNRSTAVAEDKRDDAIKELTGLIDISFFKRGDGVLVIQTTRGVELASDNVQKQLYFQPAPISARNAYPATAAGIYVGNPATDPAAVDITGQDIGGKLGGLIELRDSIFPKQMAQLDELSEQMALRFNDQGLKLFTDGTNNIPSNAAPNPTIIPPTAVAYVGFSSSIQVNANILANHSLLQQGTYNSNLPSGSNEVIRRVIQNTFGDVKFQQAVGDINLRVSTLIPPQTLQDFLGIHSTNKVDGTRNLSNFTDPATFIAAANGALAPGSDTFRVTFQDANRGILPINIDVSLGAVPNTGGDFTQDLISYINTTVIPALTGPQQADLTTMNVSFTEGPNGQLTINSNATVTTDGTAVANGMGSAGLALLGFAQSTTNATDPYFDIQVGNNAPTRITIDSNDDETDLLAKLATVPGLAVEDLTVSADGFLRVRPGTNYGSPLFGGDIKITAGPFTVSNAGANAVYGAGTIANGVNISSALFGSFSTGPLQDLSPISDVSYTSQTNGALTPPVPTLPFRTGLLGPLANVSTDIIGASSLLDFAQKMINEQSQQATLAGSRMTDEQSLQDVLQKQLSDDSGVNIDEELGQLVVIQTAYAASARVIGAVSDLFQQLLNAF